MKRIHLAGMALLSLLAACGNDDGGPDDNTPASVAYAGTFASDANSGTVLFATAPAIRAARQPNLLAVTDLVGTLTFSDNGTIDLTGTLNGTALLLAGGGYQFTGTLSGGIISGSFTGPGGESGSFSASVTTNSAQVALYCGSYDGDDAGVFSLALKPDRTGGVIVVPSSGAGGQTGRARPKSGTSDQIEVLPDAAPTFVIATGTLSAIGATAFDSISGTWDDGESVGTFGGSTRCQGGATVR